MTKFVLISLGLVLACHFSTSTTLSHPRDIPGFLYLGTARTFDGKDFNEGDYYASASSGDWSRGEEDCRSVFGPNGHMMSIQSQDEQEFLNKWLQDRGSGGAIYWTSGQFDAVTQKWRWAQSAEEVTWTNWAPQQPVLPIIGISRIALEHQNQFSATWLNEQNTGLHRYVCELHHPTTGSPGVTTPPPATTEAPTTTPDPTLPIPCPTTNDLVIVLDSSGSIGLANFQLLKEFSASLAQAFVSTPTSRLGFAVYSETVDVAIDLGESLTNDEIASRIMSATYQAGPTPTDQGIAEATRMLTKYNRGEPRTYLVITDGTSNEPDKTKEEADAAVAEGIRTFALGVTENVGEEELINIAGGNPANVFRSADFDTIVELLRHVSEHICP